MTHSSKKLSPAIKELGLEEYKPRPKSVIDIVMVVRNRIRNVHDLRLETRLATLDKAFAQLTQVTRIPCRAMFENTLTCFVGQVQAGKVGVLRFKLVNHTQRLQVVFKTAVVRGRPRARAR